MADHKTKKADDLRHIDLQEPYEAGYWSRKFGVTKEQLEAAVHKVGTNPHDVARELGR